MFNEYYKGYLGVTDQGCVFESDFRDMPLNKKFYYPVIVSEYEGRLVCSASKSFMPWAKSIFNGSEDSIKELYEELCEQGQFRLRPMTRYTYTGDILETKAVVMTENVIRFNQFVPKMNREAYIERRRDAIDEKRQFAYIKNGHIAATAFVSDVYNNGGNIVVFTKEDFRGKGYGAEVVKACVNWCIEREVVPIYLVEDHNEASIKLCESIGFEKQAKEWIISK